MAESLNSQSSNDASQDAVPTGLEVTRVLTYLVYAWTFFGIFTLTLRTFLLAASANLNTEFAAFIMRTSDTYISPFWGMFARQPIGKTGYLDVTAIFAIIIYLFFAWLVKLLIDYVNLKIQNKIAEERQKQLQGQFNNSNLEITAIKKQKTKRG